MKKGQEPAFPVSTIDGFTQHGMSKRFYAACAAMQGIMANEAIIKGMNKLVNNELSEAAYFAKAAYELADELLNQEDSE